MTHVLPRAAAAAVTALLIALTVSPGVARAHEHRTVGAYEFVVGFLVEPPFEGDLNGLDLSIKRDGAPVLGADQTLRLEVTYTESQTTRAFTLEASDEEPGHYAASFVPTVSGQYSFHVTGTLEGTAVDETFTSGPDTFSDVQSTADLEFPQVVPSGRELAAQARGAADLASQAEDAASSARGLAIVGIVCGLVGIAAGGAGLTLGLRRR